MNVSVDFFDTLCQTYIDKWTSIVDQMKDLCTLSPDAVFFTTEGNRDAFLVRLRRFLLDLKHLEDTTNREGAALIGEYKLFDNSNGEDNLNSFCGISAFLGAVQSIDRVYNAYLKYVEYVNATPNYIPTRCGKNGDVQAIDAGKRSALVTFFLQTLFPANGEQEGANTTDTVAGGRLFARPGGFRRTGMRSTANSDERVMIRPKIDNTKCKSVPIYHTEPMSGVSSLVTVADLMRRIHTEYVHQHLNHMIDADAVSSGMDKNRYAVPVVSANYRIDDIAQYVNTLDTYPIVPEDLAGNIFPTCSEEAEKVNRVLTEPGPCSSVHITSIEQDRICTRCKLHFVTLGQTDEIEQRLRFKCTCTYTMEHKVNTQAMAIESSNKLKEDVAKHFIQRYENGIEDDEQIYTLTNTGETTSQMKMAWNLLKTSKEATRAFSMMPINFQHLDEFKSTRANRALSLTRLVCGFNKNTEGKHVGGCSCNEHINLFKHATAMNKLVFDKITAFQKRYESK